jgi:hypothetical protein
MKHYLKIHLNGEKVMSGPKISEAELERRRQAELERLRQEKLRALDEYSRAKQGLKEYAEHIKKFMSVSVGSFVDVGDLRFDVQVIQDAATLAEGQIREILSSSANPPGETGQIREQTGRLVVRLKEIEKQFKVASTEFDLRVKEYTDVLRNQQERQRMSDQLANSKEEQRVFNVICFALEEKEPTAPVGLNTEELITEIKILIQNPASCQDRKTLSVILRDIEQLNDEAKKQSILSQYTVLRSAVWQNIREFKLYYNKYQSLYFAWAQLVYAGQEHIPAPRSQIDFLSVNELVNAVKQLEKDYKKEDEMAFIREKMSQVMREFGYSTLEPIQLRNLPQGKSHFLAEATTSGQAPVHIEIDEKGTFLMEVQGLEGSDGDNLYEATGLALEEKEYLTQQQTNFCQQYPKIVERLDELGIRFKKKQHLDPGVYCTRIHIKGKRSSFAKFKEQQNADTYSSILQEKERR